MSEPQIPQQQPASLAGPQPTGPAGSQPVSPTELQSVSPVEPQPVKSNGIEPGPHHMHPSYVVLSSLAVTGSILLAGFFSLIGSVAEEVLNGGAIPTTWILIGIVVLVVLIAVVAVISYIYYKRYRWELTDSDIHIYSGIIFKKQNHIPFQRVQSIDFRASIIQRILGIVRLKIETAGGAANKAVIIPALKLSQAEAFRTEVFARKRVAVQQRILAQQPQSSTGSLSAAIPFEAVTIPQTGADQFVQQIGDNIGGLRGVFADDYDETAPIECEYGLSAKELVFSAVSGDHNLVFIAFLIGGLSQLGPIISMFHLEDVVLEALEYATQSYLVPVIAGGIIILSLLAYLLGILGTAIQYGGFKARRRGGRIETEMGLLSRQYKGVAVSRVQSVQIKQGAIRRLFGYAELKLLTIDSTDPGQSQNGGQAASSIGLVIHPFIKLAKIDPLLHEMVPEYDGRCTDAELRKLPKIALRRMMIRHVMIFAIFYAAFAAAMTLGAGWLPAENQIPVIPWFIALLWILLGLFVIAKVFASLLWYRQSAYAYNSQMLTIRTGFFAVTTTIIGKRRIQWAQSHQNPFQRRAKVASIKAVTAAGVTGTETKLRDLTAEEAAAYLEWIRPHSTVKN